MTNREYILKLLAGADDGVLFDAYENLPDELRNRQPIITACQSCPKRNADDCYADYESCDKHISAWMAAEVQFK